MIPDFFPVRVTIKKKQVWDIDHAIRTHLKLSTVRPPLDYSWKGLIKKEGRSIRRRTLRPAPVIPNYIFPSFTTYDDYHRFVKFAEATDLCGVQGLLTLGNAGEPYRLKPDDIHFLEAANEGAARAKTVIHKGIKVGDDVAIKRESFAGFAGKFTGVDRDYAEVLISMLGQMRTVRVPLDAIGPV